MKPDYFPFLKYLNLTGTSVVTIPKSISRFTKLKELQIYNCNQLREIPILPQSIRRVYAKNSLLLDPQSSSRLLIQASLSILEKLFCYFGEILRDSAISDILIDPQPSSGSLHEIVLSSSLFDDFSSETEDYGSEDEHDDCEITVPGTEIPKWFNYQSVGRKFPKFVVCIAFGPEAHIGECHCKVYLSINGCEKNFYDSIFMKEISNHLWLISISHQALLKKLNYSNLFEQNHVEVIWKIENWKISSSPNPENLTNIIKKKSGIFHDYYKNVDDDSQEERCPAMFSFTSILETQNMPIGEPGMQHQFHSNIVPRPLNECEVAKMVVPYLPFPSATHDGESSLVPEDTKHLPLPLLFSISYGSYMDHRDFNNVGIMGLSMKTNSGLTQPYLVLDSMTHNDVYGLYSSPIASIGYNDSNARDELPTETPNNGFDSNLGGGKYLGFDSIFHSDGYNLVSSSITGELRPPAIPDDTRHDSSPSYLRLPMDMTSDPT
ncbi:hypothetical protein CFP56_010735 [Quercus suber]|uniref:Uncharacterized protein n=1 Tax=Quercus suber TaxID=58331 RepID=A0AAW0L164_QUESU